MSLMRSFFLALSNSERLREMMVRFGPARRMARRFVAGERLEEAISAVRALNESGLLATLDHLGENVTSETEARDATTEILDLLAAIEASGVRSGVSVKLTQLGLDLHPALAAENLERIVARAAEVRRFVRIDMESHEYIQPTLDLFEGFRFIEGHEGSMPKKPRYWRCNAATLGRFYHDLVEVLQRYARDMEPDEDKDLQEG